MHGGTPAGQRSSLEVGGVGRVSDGSRVALTPLPCPQRTNAARACAARCVYRGSALRDARSVEHAASRLARSSPLPHRTPLNLLHRSPGPPILLILLTPAPRSSKSAMHRVLGPPRPAAPHPPSAVVNLAPSSSHGVACDAAHTMHERWPIDSLGCWVAIPESRPSDSVPPMPSQPTVWAGAGSRFRNGFQLA